LENIGETDLKVVKVVNVKIVKERSMKRKGFTLVELLVVIAIIALLMAILVPALAKARALAYRMLCGSNLSGIGKAMAIYSQDHDGDYPVAGGPGATWSTLGGVNNIGWLKNWSEPKTFGNPPNNRATITSCFYLLVRYGQASAKQFVCKGDQATIFRLSLFNIAPKSIFETWDFGDGAQVWPGECCSYSYHMPFAIPDPREGMEGEMTTFMVRERSPENSPLCADRNPFLDQHLAGTIPGNEDNAYAHNGNGQNVLYKDNHVDFERDPLVGIGGDNIWCYFDGSDQPPQFVGDDGPPLDRTDAYLVNEYQDGTLP
jgi:prepilin-type N-terminal cleavage/methylation domain-containing protein